MLNRSLYIFASRLLGFAVRVIVPYFLVRTLTKADFGAYRQFFLLEVMFATVFQIGINQGLYYFIPRDEKNAGAYFLNSLLLNLAVFGLAFCGASLFAERLSHELNMPILGRYFWQLAAFTLVLMLAVANDCYLLARKRVREAALLDILGQVLLSGGTVLAAYVWGDLRSILTTLIVAKAVHLVIGVAYTHFGLRGFSSVQYRFGVRQQLRYGLMLGLGGTFWTLMLRMHDLVVSRYYGTEAYAVYSAGVTPVPLVEMYMYSLASVSLGEFARLEKEGDWPAIRDLWRRIQAGVYGIALPFMVLLLLVSEPLVLFLFTQEYADAVGIFRINVLVNLNTLFNATLILRAMNRNDVILRWHLILLAAAPPLLWLGMRAGGTLGIIGTHVALVTLGRLVLLRLLNGVSGGGLVYVPHPREILAFYRDSWRALAGKLGAAAIGRRRKGENR